MYSNITDKGILV